MEGDNFPSAGFCYGKGVAYLHRFVIPTNRSKRIVEASFNIQE